MRWLKRRLWGRTSGVRFGGPLVELEDRTTPATFRWMSTAATGNFSDANNWLNDSNTHQAPPANGTTTDLVFDVVNANGTTANNDLSTSTESFRSLAFNVNNFTLTGGGFQLTTGVSVRDSGQLAVINPQVTISSSSIVTVGGAGAVEVVKSFSGAGKLNVTGTLLLNNSQATNQALSVNTTIANGGVVRLMQASQTNSSYGIDIQTGGLFDLASYKTVMGSLTGSGSVELGNNTASFLAVGNSTPTGGPFTFSGVISGAGQIRASGGGWTITGNNSYTGGTSVTTPTGIIVDGTVSPSGSPILLESGYSAKISGRGSVSEITFSGGGNGRVGPGRFGEPGQLTVAGLSGGRGNFEFDIGGNTPGTEYDQLLVRHSNTTNGLVNLTSGTSTLILKPYGGYSPRAGSKFVLIDNDDADPTRVSFQYDSGSGLKTLAEGDTLTFQNTTLSITYRGGDGNDVVLTETTPVLASLNATGGQATMVGTTFADITVTATSTTGQPMSGVTVSVGGPSNGPGFVPVGSQTTNLNGRAVFQLMANTVAGDPYTATFTGSDSVGGASRQALLRLTNLAGAATNLTVLDGDNQQTTVGENFSRPLEIVLQDQFLNPVSGVTVSFRGPPAELASVVQVPTDPPTDVNGRVRLTVKANEKAGGPYLVTATTPGGLSHDFSLTNTVATLFALQPVSGDNKSTLVGSQFSTPVVLRAVDRFDNRLAGGTVTVQDMPAGAAGATFTTPAATAADGMTSFQATANNKSGTYPVFATATLAGISKTSTFLLTNTADVAVLIGFVSGDNQTARVCEDFQSQLVVLAKDQYGNPAPNASVGFTARSQTAATATSLQSQTTGDDGLAKLTPRANERPGAYTVTALLAGTTSQVAFTATNQVGALDHVSLISGGGRLAVVRTPFTDPVVVRAEDKYANPLPAATISVLPQTGVAKATLTGPTLPDADGRSSFTAIANNKAGRYTLTVRASLGGLEKSTDVTLTNFAGVATQLVLLSAPNPAMVNATFDKPARVQLLDQDNNGVPRQTVTFVAGVAASGATAAGAGPVPTDADGVAEFTPTANSKAGSYPVTATAGSLSKSVTLTNRAGPVARVELAGGGPSAEVGRPFPVVTVRVWDADDNPVGSTAVTVQWPPAGAGIEAVPQLFTTAGGSADFTPVANDKPGGPYTVTVSAGGKSAPLTLENLAGPVADLTLTDADQAAVVGTPFKTVTVRATDRFGNPLARLSVGLTQPTTGAAVTGLPPTLTTDDDGTAVFTPKAGTTAGGPYTVTLSAGTRTADLTLTDLPDALAGLTLTGDNQAAEVGTTFAPVTVRASDQYGNPLAGQIVALMWPGAGASTTGLPPALTTAIDGTATFTPAADRTAGTYVISVSAGGQTVPLTLTNRPGALARLALTGNGQAAEVGTAFAPVTVQATDQYGNPLAGLDVGLSQPAAGANAALPPTLTTAADGSAAVTPVAGTTAGRYVVRLAAGGQVADLNLVNRPGPVAAVMVVSGDGQTASAGGAFAAPIRLRAADQYGNPVAGASVTLAQAAGVAVTLTPPPPTDAQGLTQMTATAMAAAGNSTVAVTVGGSTIRLSLTTTPVGGGGGTASGVRLPREFAAGADRGGGAVTLYNPDGTARYTVTPFPGISGGVRVAAADFNGDGVADLVIGTGPGSPTRVLVLDGATQAVLFQINPFEASFTGGLFVAAGDLTGDGTPELVISPDEGGGPRVRVFDGKDFGQVADFFGIDDPNFRGGARTAVGDIDGDGVGNLIVAAGFGGGPRVAVFDGSVVAGGAYTRRLTPDFFAFEETLRNGVYIAAGDLDGDGKAELIAGGGPGGGPRVSAFSGAGLLRSTQTRIADFFAGDPDNRGGVRLAVKNLDGDNRADLLAGAGTAAGSRVTAYAGTAVVGNGLPDPLLAFDALPGFSGGVFVG